MSSSDNFEGKTESLYLLEQELDAACAAGAPHDELGAIGKDIHRLRLDLGIEVELTDEQRTAYSNELRDRNTTLERVKEIDAIAQRSVPPNHQH